MRHVQVSNTAPAFTVTPSRPKPKTEPQVYLTISEGGRYAGQTISISGPKDVVLQLHEDWLKRTERPSPVEAKAPMVAATGTF